MHYILYRSEHVCLGVGAPVPVNRDGNGERVCVSQCAAGVYCNVPAMKRGVGAHRHTPSARRRTVPIPTVQRVG